MFLLGTRTDSPWQWVGKCAIFSAIFIIFILIVNLDREKDKKIEELTHKLQKPKFKITASQIYHIFNPYIDKIRREEKKRKGILSFVNIISSLKNKQ